MTLTLDKDGERLDSALSRLVPELTRSQAQRLIEQGAVTRDGRPVKKNEKLPAGTTLELAIPEVRETPIAAQEIPLEVCYEDADVIVVNKPKGLVVHPAPGHADGTLVNALLAHCGNSLSGIGGEKRPGIVHRIDKDTSGLIIAAKNDFAHAALAAQLKDHSLARTYVCIVCGNIKDDSFENIMKSEKAKEVAEKVKACDRNCAFIVTERHDMIRKPWKPIMWILKNKIRIAKGKDICW